MERRGEKRRIEENREEERKTEERIGQDKRREEKRGEERRGDERRDGRSNSANFSYTRRRIRCGSTEPIHDSEISVLALFLYLHDNLCHQ